MFHALRCFNRVTSSSNLVALVSFFLLFFVFYVATSVRMDGAMVVRLFKCIVCGLFRAGGAAMVCQNDRVGHG